MGEIEGGFLAGRRIGHDISLYLNYSEQLFSSR